MVYTASKKPGMDFPSTACVIKRKLSLNLSQQTQYFRVDMSWGERNTAVTTYFGEIAFFTKMETIFNNTDCDKLL